MQVTQINVNNSTQIGRLGNQMFVIASIIGLAKTTNNDYAFPEWKYQNHINKDLLPKIGTVNGYTNVGETKHGYDEKLITAIEEVLDYEFINVCGYLQDYRYFDKHRELICDLFTPNWKSNDGVCSIHVRRGDYVRLQKFHPCCTMEYYNTAMGLILEKNKNIKFRVFSDDIPWCKDQFKHTVSFSENQTEYDDLVEMSQCEYNIIANSSFSWWSGYLNRNPNKLVVIPKQWFGVNYKGHNTDGYNIKGSVLI